MLDGGVMERDESLIEHSSSFVFADSLLDDAA
jgi:hypothetical protein